MIDIVQSDAVEWAHDYEGSLFHALLCDPPYHLTSITKRFGKEGSAPAQFGTDGAFTRASKGFMGKVWDGGDVAFRPETWYAFMRILHLGAFGMAFASSRGWHRLACAIEDAGFIIHPTIFLWVQGQGFPKATRIDTQIDREAGVEQKKIPNPLAKKQTGQKNTTALRDRNDNVNLSLPATDLAKAWAGHRYGLQTLKPSCEPIIVFQKPYEGRPLDCMTRTGAGAINIDGGRIASESMGIRQRKAGSEFGQNSGWNDHNNVDTIYDGTKGRWPANFILDEEAGKRLDEQSGIQKGGFVRNRTDGARPFENNGKDTGYEQVASIDEPDGGASRFFYQVQEQIDENDPIFYCAKAGKEERDAGLNKFDLQSVKTHGEMGVDKTGESHNTTGQRPAIRHNPTSLVA